MHADSGSLIEARCVQVHKERRIIAKWLKIQIYELQFDSQSSSGSDQFQLNFAQSILKQRGCKVVKIIKGPHPFLRGVN